MKEKVKILYLEGYDIKEIANKLEKSESSVRKIIDRNFKEIKEMRKQGERSIFLNNIKTLYLKGYNAKEIADSLGYSHTRIKRLISQNFKDLLEEHKKARSYNSSIKKSINHINNSFISDSALLKINRQSYKYNKNYNLVFDEETRGKRTEDIPKVYYRRKNIK